MPNKKLVNAHVDKNNLALICCPFCGFAKKVSVSQFINVNHRISTRCTCGEQFDIQLNFRKHYRKKVDLTGTFMLVNVKMPAWKKIRIRNISMGGIGFSPIDPATVQKNDVLRVKFQLDNNKKTHLEKKVVVKFVAVDYVGCEFQDLALEEKELGFYLFS